MKILNKIIKTKMLPFTTLFFCLIFSSCQNQSQDEKAETASLMSNSGKIQTVEVVSSC